MSRARETEGTIHGLAFNIAAALLGGWSPGLPGHHCQPIRQDRGVSRSAEDQPSRCTASYASAGRDAKNDWKTLSERIGHSDAAFTMRQYVQTGLEVHRQVATTLAELVAGGVVPGAQSPALPGNGPDASV